MTPSTASLSKPRIYGFTSYDRSAKVRWLLTELGQEYETKILSSAEREAPAFLKLSPMGRVPVLETSDQVIFESGAICAYLGDLFPERGLAPAIGSPDRALYQQWMYFASATLDVFQIRIMVIEDIPAGDVHTKKQTALQSDLRDAMDALDRALSKGPFLLGNKMTTPDLCVAYHAYWLTLWPELEVVMRDFPRVMDYLERMKATPSAAKADVFSYKE